jgi:hypothetical protein
VINKLLCEGSRQCSSRLHQGVYQVVGRLQLSTTIHNVCIQVHGR